jgi:hypothetical protein
MVDTYRSRICPICSGVVKCDLKSTPNDIDNSFNVAFTAVCSRCGLSVEGNKSSMFDLFSEAKVKAVGEVDDKWVYTTSTYRSLT